MVQFAGANRTNASSQPSPAKPSPRPVAGHADGLTRIRITIKGKAPGLLYQGKGVMEADEDSPGKKTKKRAAAEEARMRGHWTSVNGKETMCIPWVMIYKSLCSASGAFKYKGQKTYATLIAATVSCETDRIPLNTDQFEVYEEYVRVPPRTGVMVKIGRPRLKEWQASFTLIVDDELYRADVIKDILIHAGKLVGIGAWRPELKGAHGRFSVEEFEYV